VPGDPCARRQISLLSSSNRVPQYVHGSSISRSSQPAHDVRGGGHGCLQRTIERLAADRRTGLTANHVAGKHYKIETKYYDDVSNAQQSATLAEKLIREDNVNFLLGPYGTSPTLQVSTVAEKNKVPMIEGNGAAESIFTQGYKYTFGVLSPAQTILIVEQDVQAALERAARGYVLETGRVVLEGTGNELLSDERVRGAYLGV
jgi:hypothetical protein